MLLLFTNYLQQVYPKDIDVHKVAITAGKQISGWARVAGNRELQ